MSTNKMGPVRKSISHLSQAGQLPSHGKVQCNPDLVTNVFSLGELSNHYRVFMDTAKENAFFVCTPQGVVKFGRDDTNLYCWTSLPSRPVL